MIQRIIVAVVFCSVFVPVAFVFAQALPATSNLDAITIKQIQDLLHVVESLQKQLNALQAELGAAAPPAKSETKQIFPDLKRPLSRGDRGDDVRSLQEFLATDPQIYPEGLITGYFGPFTETALKRWQERHDIEAIGAVGAKTIAKFNELSDGQTGTPGGISPSALNTSTVQNNPGGILLSSGTTTPPAATSTPPVATSTPPVGTSTPPFSPPPPSSSGISIPSTPVNAPLPPSPSPGISPPPPPPSGTSTPPTPPPPPPPPPPPSPPASGGLPDLIPTSITVTPSPLYNWYYEMDIKVSVTNAGTGSAAASKLGMVTFTPSPVNFDTPALAPGASTIVEWAHAFTTVNPGSFTFSAIADLNNVISETSESNNTISTPVTVVAPPLPAPPQGLTAVQQGTNTVHISWSPSQYASSYNLYRGASWNLQGNANTSYDDTGLAAGTYSYHVTACNQPTASIACSASSNVVSVTVAPPSAPAAPVLSVSTSQGGTGDTNVHLSWTTDPSSYITYIVLFRTTSGSSAPDPWSYSLIVGSGSTFSYDDFNSSTHPLPAGTYYYKVKACNTYGCSAYTNYSNVVTAVVSNSTGTCPDLVFGLKDNKTSYTVGETGYVTYTCSLPVYVCMRIIDSAGTVKNIGCHTDTSGIDGFGNTSPGNYTARACYGATGTTDCPTIAASLPFTVVASSAASAVSDQASHLASLLESISNILNTLLQILSTPLSNP